MNALKCDRCNDYFDYEQDKDNFISFGHKDIVVGRNFPVKDICPNCMSIFKKWFGILDEEKNSELSCHFEHCKDCASLIFHSIPREEGIAEVRCGRWHTGIPLRGAKPSLIDSITPDMFMTEEAINKYKDEEKQKGNCIVSEV